MCDTLHTVCLICTEAPYENCKCNTATVRLTTPVIQGHTFLADLLTTTEHILSIMSMSQAHTSKIKPHHRVAVSHGALAVSSCCICGMALLLPPTQQRAPVDCPMTILEQAKQRGTHVQAAPVPRGSTPSPLTVLTAPSECTCVHRPTTMRGGASDGSAYNCPLLSTLLPPSPKSETP